MNEKPSFRDLVRTAARIALFRPVSEAELGVSWLQVGGLVAASLIIPLAYAIATVSNEGHLAWMQLPAVLFHVPVMLLTAIAVTDLVGRREQVKTLLAASLLAWIAIDFVSLGTWLLADDAWPNRPMLSMAWYYVPIAWLALAVARFAVAMAPVSVARRAWVVLACVVFLALPLAGVFRERSLWSMDYGRENAEAMSRRAAMRGATSEEAFYRQPQLLERELAAVQPGRKGAIDLYLVAVAGYGQQDVFLREVDAVATLFSERFDSAGRTVKLINNPKTVMTHPVASATSLKAALHRVSEAMNGDEDILVLFLTSHGSNTHHFSLTLWPLDLTQITPPMLRQILDESGIANRVVIVSACYAGGFLQPLESETTLVITAAAPDRNSFGCSNEADWTYFGKAYFDEALRGTSSFVAAFETAKPLIEQREKAGKHEPSNPQISAGAAIKAKLADFERQLKEKR